jgi:hypothetical protein
MNRPVRGPVRSGPLPAPGPELALLLAATAVTLVVAWPGRPDLANASWQAVAVVRAGGLALWGWLSATAAPPSSPREPLREVIRLGVAAVVTAPLEALAFVGSAPSASLAWSLAVAVPLGATAYGLGWTLGAALRSVRSAWLMPLASPLVVGGLLFLDLRVGPPVLLPWLLPGTPSLAAASVLTLATGLVVARAVRGARRGSP